MRDFRLLDIYRNVRAELEWAGSSGHPRAGIFEVPSCTDRKPLRVIATNAEGWDHASVSRKDRCPNWPEMDQLKRLLFHDWEPAMQYHPAVADYVNNHRYCLHWWRPHDAEIPQPPISMIGVKGLTPENIEEMDPAERKRWHQRMMEEAVG